MELAEAFLQDIIHTYLTLNSPRDENGVPFTSRIFTDITENAKLLEEELIKKGTSAADGSVSGFFVTLRQMEKGSDDEPSDAKCIDYTLEEVVGRLFADVCLRSWPGGSFVRF